MARRGMLTALQAALEGIGGAAGGYVQMEETKRRRQQDEDARKRQEMLDVVGLQERGFMSPEQLAQQKMQGTKTAGSVLQNAFLSAMNPRAGVLPPPTAQDVGTTSEALATAGRTPQRITTTGGQEMVRLETPQQEEQRLGLLKEERGRMSRFQEQQFQRDLASEARREQQIRDEANRKFTEEQNRLDRVSREGIAAANRIAELEKSDATNKLDPVKMAQLGRLRAGVSEMRNAHDNMMLYEDAVKQGKTRITVPNQILSNLAKSFTSKATDDQILSSFAMNALGKSDPQLYRYIRRGLSFAEGEMMISQRPSDYRTKMATFLSMAATGHSPESISDIQQRRSAILDPLSFVSGEEAGAPPPPTTPPPLYRSRPTPRP